MLVVGFVVLMVVENAGLDNGAVLGLGRVGGHARVDIVGVRVRVAQDMYHYLQSDPRLERLVPSVAVEPLLPRCPHSTVDQR